MAEMSRRTFLIRGSLGAAAAAVASALPNLPTLAGTAAEDAPAEDDAATTLASEALPSTWDPLIAHVTDLRTGQLSVFVGEREFTVVDRALAGRLFQVTK